MSRKEFRDAAKPYRSYRVGYVYRNEKPGPGRFRQFMQFDADTVGTPICIAGRADAEMCMMAADTMDALGIARGAYVGESEQSQGARRSDGVDRPWWR